MRVGVLSDVHGNAAGLDAVLNAMPKVDLLLFAGDFLGYYFEPATTLRRLRDSGAVCILGNHDVYFLAHAGLAHPDAPFPDADAYRLKYGPALEIARDTLTTAEVEWLSTLPAQRSLQLEGVHVLLAHGSPWRPVDEYVYPDNPAFERFSNLETDLVVMGHTHHPFVRIEGGVTLLNPGSCGQPRDRDPRAAFALIEIDGSNHSCTLSRATYDRRALLATCMAIAPDVPLLRDLLTRADPPDPT